MSSLGARLELLHLLVVREIRTRYARTALGVAWALVPPVATVALFGALDLRRLAGADSAWRELPYAVTALTGLVFWNHVSQSLVGGTASLANSRDMLHRAAFPAELIPLSRVLAALLDLGIGCVLVLLLMAFHGVAFRATALAIPIVFLFQLAFTSGLVLLLSAVNVFFRDVQYVLQVFVLLLLFASDVVVPVDGAGGARWIFAVNPVASYMHAYRSLLLAGEVPSLHAFAPGAIGGLVVFAVGACYFRRVAPRFAEEV